MKIIVIVATIIIIIGILAVLFVFFYEPEKHFTTPKGSLYFSEYPEGSGKYYGEFMGSVMNKDLKIKLYDVSLDIVATMDNPTHGEVIQIPGGYNLTYFDTNSNMRQDGSDLLLAQGIEPGDKIAVVYKPTGSSIATWTLK